MSELEKYEQLKNNGAGPREIYLILIKDKILMGKRFHIMRRLFNLPIEQIKDIAATSSGKFKSLEDYQDSFGDSIEDMEN